MSQPSSKGPTATNDTENDALHAVKVSDESDNSEPGEEAPSSSADANSLKRKSDEVWQYFTVHIVNGLTMVECTFCETMYKVVKGDTISISTLRHHINNCSRIKRAKGNTSGSKPICDSEDESEGESEDESEGESEGENEVVTDRMKNREMLAKMILVHELPFMFVEYKWFNILMKHMNPLYRKVNINTIKKECTEVFENEKEKIKQIFTNVSRISLTCDYWTSNQTIDYMCLTAHYIDDEWTLQKRIISFNEVSPPHSGVVISDAIMESLMKWGIENKIGTITFDNAFNNDKAADILRLSFEARDKLHFQGFFFQIRCCAHVLDLVAQDGLSKIGSCLGKIREGLKYLKQAPARLLKFEEIAIQLGIPTQRSLCMDVKVRWNSTYHMLDSALHYKKVFSGYALSDSNFEWLPDEIEWEKAEKVCKLLEVFSEATDIFSSTSYPTSNLFLFELFNVKEEICDAYNAVDGFTREMSMAMYEKFEKYWGEIDMLMAVASILDPRFKMLLIEFCYRRLYPSSEVETRVADVLKKLRALYELYVKEYVASTIEGSSSSAVAVVNSHGGKKSKFRLYMESVWKEVKYNSDLDNYLEDSVFPDRHTPFDVLEWWKRNAVMYPILSKLARDVLCIPISKVMSESAFSASGRVLDDYKSSLTNDMIEILVCGGDWIRESTGAELPTLQQASKVEESLEIHFPMSKLNVNSS